MARKKYKEIYIDRDLLPLLEELINDPEVKMGLLEFGLKSEATGVAKYAVRRLLKDKNKFRTSDKTSHKTSV